MKAAIEIQGKQYLVKKGDQIKVSKISKKAGEKFEVESVLLLDDEGRIVLGTPTVKGAKVTVSILDHKQGKKVRVATYQPKKRHRRVLGYRDQLSILRIEEITK